MLRNYKGVEEALFHSLKLKYAFNPIHPVKMAEEEKNDHSLS